MVVTHLKHQHLSLTVFTKLRLHDITAHMFSFPFPVAAKQEVQVSLHICSCSCVRSHARPAAARGPRRSVQTSDSTMGTIRIQRDTLPQLQPDRAVQLQACRGPQQVNTGRARKVMTGRGQQVKTGVTPTRIFLAESW